MDGQPAERARLGMGLPAKLVIRNALQCSARIVHLHVEFGKHCIFVGQWVVS